MPQKQQQRQQQQQQQQRQVPQAAKAKPVPKSRPLPTTARELRTLTLSAGAACASPVLAGGGTWHHTCLCAGVDYACAACGHLGPLASMHVVPLSEGALVVCSDRSSCVMRR